MRKMNRADHREVEPAADARRVSPPRISLDRSQVNGVSVVDIQIEDGPLAGSSARVVPSRPSSAYFRRYFAKTG